MRWITRLSKGSLYSLLLVAGCQTLLTGSPVPLWRIEQLDSPQTVKAVNGPHLELTNGQKVALPFIKALPQDNPFFQAALSSGIEISPTGEVFGLMWCDRICGNDPVVWKKLRVNLSDLAAVLHPAGIDESVVHPDVIEFIQEHKQIVLSPSSHSHRSYHINGHVLSSMRSVRRLIESSSNDNAGL
jgi:hypothetical protein